MFRKIFAVLALFMTLTTQSWSAEFFVLPGTKTLLVLGETKNADVEIIKKYIADVEIDSLFLKGPGGSFMAGLSIANIVIENELSTSIPENTDCASACSLIFAAGSNRSMEAGARLGFHLPFLDFDSDLIFGGANKYCAQLKGNEDVFMHVKIDEECLKLTYLNAQEDMRLLSKILARDGISEEVIDLIYSTPAGDMSWMSVGDATDYGLVNTD